MNRLRFIGIAAFFAGLAVLSVPPACDKLKGTGGDASKSGRAESRPQPIASPPQKAPSIDEGQIDQDLQARAADAEKFLMDKMGAVADLKETETDCLIDTAETIRQAENVTMPYSGNVVLHIPDDHLDYQGKI